MVQPEGTPILAAFAGEMGLSVESWFEGKVPTGN